MIIEGPIKLPFTYAAGGVGSRFLIALRDRQAILAADCESCGHVACPPPAFCTACGGSITNLVEVGPHGTVEAWTDIPGKGTFGLIRLDGVDTAMVHLLLGGTGAWKTGARVSARFAAERVGGITDIEGFGPLRGGQ